jgi:hypothetical protein
MAKHRKRGSSKAGRPRKDGDRYPSGKLKPRGPNETTLAKRRAGDASAGEHPLDFALSKGWLTERQHKDAMAYRATYNLAHAGRFGPRLAQGDLAEVEPSEALRESWSSLSDAQIASVFDTVFNVTPPTAEREQKEAAARLRWKLINASLSSAQRQEVFMVAVLGSWPFWMVRAGQAGQLTVCDIVKHQTLIDGLTAIGLALRPSKEPSAEIILLGVLPKGREGRSEGSVIYVTPTGELAEAVSERGVPFEVKILSKRV